MPCRSVPASGSVSASPPRTSPLASLGSHVSFCALGAELLDRQRQHQVRVEDAGDGHPVARDAHHDLGVGAGRQAEPAVLRRDGGAEQAQLLHLLDGFGGIAVGVVVFLGDRLDLLLDPPVDGGEQLRFVLRIDIAQLRRWQTWVSSVWARCSRPLVAADCHTARPDHNDRRCISGFGHAARAQGHVAQPASGSCQRAASNGCHHRPATTTPSEAILRSPVRRSPTTSA